MLCQRDFLRIEQMSVIVTGDRPTGRLHLGHYVGSLKNRLALQGQHPMYIIIADTQVMNNDAMKCRQSHANIRELVKDYLAVGIDPAKATIFVQSSVSQLFELTAYLSNITTLAQVMRNPTIKAENDLYNNTLSLGFINYPVSQTADIVMFDGDLVPVGADQLPILDLANDLIQRFNHMFGPKRSLQYIHPMLSETPRLVGIDGSGKMSKSLNNSIHLSDDEATVNAAVKAMYTDEGHLKVSDPGKVEGNVVFAFLDAFHTDKEEVAALKDHYRRGGLGDMALKRMLMADLQTLLAPIREARADITDAMVYDVISSGNRAANMMANHAMDNIREAMFG
jgi:tryptophanyl-tRNA synthetase